ncbi:Ig-like domain repeat protein [Treponema denticola]|uniref:Ig-like domain repeat protein n=1 Tax=Treponema denticola TaxID=158 RepID=UPI002105B776|nr:Ig-like domain repeat protein [Treponema denticola]UTY23148.1 hypothetical protein E4N78_02570 [Treponema denticola]
MKKKNNILFFTLVICTVMTVFTCKQNIGLGASVNVAPPIGEIGYPNAGETPIRGSFVMRGTASDENGIKSVSIVFQNIETDKKTEVFEAVLTGSGTNSVTWSADINNKSTGHDPEHELVKVYPIPDGEYTAQVTVTDKGGVSSIFTKNYKIDNTPPVFIVSRPSTVVYADDTTTLQADGYGAIFSVIGQAGERNTVEKLNVHVPGASPIDITNMFVGNNINAQVAVYTPTNALYGLQAQDKTKPIRGQLYLYDNAREYNGGEASGEGNKAEWYYLRENIYESVLEKGYTAEVISDYFAGKKGSDKNDHDKKIKELRSDTAALAKLKSKIEKMSEKRSSFKLDPSKSPGFKVIGVKHLSGPMTPGIVSQSSSMLFKAGSDTKFSVELIPNKDNIPLVGGSGFAAYKNSKIKKIVLLKWNGSDFDSGNPISLIDFETLTETYFNTHPDMIKKEGGNLRIQCTFPSDKGEGYYAVKVDGTDISDEDSNKFEAYDDSNTASGGFYIINFLAVGNGPRIRAIRPQGFQKGNFEIFAAVTGIDSTGVVYYNIGGSVPTSPYPATVLTKADPANQSDHKYKATIDVSSLSDGDHEIHFLVKAGSGSTDADKTDFAIDKTPPTADISYPLPADPQAGKITISGTITDGTGSSVKEAGTKYILGKKSSTPALTDSGWQNMTTSTKGSWNVDVDLDTMSAHPENYGTQVGTSSYYKVPLYIRTEDMLGNATVHTKEILFNSDGTKPVVRVLSPQADAIVGGTIQIFGTASAVTGGPSAVGEVYVQFSKTSDFTNVSNMTFGTTGGGYDADWYKSGNGQLVPGTNPAHGQSGAEWRLEINGNGAFNGTSQRQDLYFRFRAKNKNYSDRWGEWTTPVKIIVDKDAPLITDVKIENISTPPSPQNYETNMWIGSGKKLTAKLTDPSGIKEVKITSDKMSGGISYTQTTAPTGWLTPYSAGGVSGYTLSIPLNISGMLGNDFSIKVEITEDTTTGLKSDSTFTFRFDTTAPTGFFGSGLYINSGYFGTSSITNTALADKLRELGAGESSGAGCKILAENTELTVSGVSGSVVNFTPSISAKEYSYILYKPEELIYNGESSSPWIVKGVANDDGSGIAKVEAWVKVDGTETAHTIITETDNTNKITRQLGGQVTWKGKIDLSSLKDGKGTLHYKITDKSGNTYTAPAVAVRVKNKPVKVKTITLVTDIGGSAVEFANNNVNKALKDIDVDSNLDFTANYTSSAFAFKNKTNSKIKVEFTGGQPQVKYTLKYNNVVLAGHDMQNISNGDIITLSEANLTTIGNTTGETTKELVLELWDSASGCTPTGTAPLEKSSFAQIKINTLFDALDDKAPKVVVLPFYWNGEGKDLNNNSLNSLYGGSSKNGHVEIAPVTGLTANTSDNNSYSSVSGKVTLRGFAYDNIKIDTVTAVLPGKTLSATLSGAGPKWTAGTMASDGAVLTVEKLGADYLGYYVKWTLDWDTEKTTNVGLAQEIKITVNDGTTASSDGKANMPNAVTGVTRANENSAQNDVFTDKNPGQFVVFTKGEKQYLTRLASVSGNKVTLENNVPVDVKDVFVYGYNANEAKTNVNVVPFITGLERPDTYNTNRSSSGAYNLLRSDMVTLTGFNLGGAGATVKAVIPNGTASGSEAPISGNKFTLPAAAKSGSIVITVDPDGAGTKPAVEAINNKNNNSKPYNRQDIENRPETKYWTDDLTIDVWKDDEQFAGSDNPKYPSMAMGSNGDLYAAYSNYSESKVYYSKLGGAPQSVYWGYDPPEEAAISVNGANAVNILYSANYHAGAIANWKANIYGAGGLYCYDANAPDLKFFHSNGGKIYRFELFYHQKQLQQFKNFRIARKNNNIHIAYYDTMAASVKYSSVQSGTTNADITSHNGEDEWQEPADNKNNCSEIAWVDLDGSTLPDVLPPDPNLKRVGTVAVLSNSQFENGLQRTGGTTEYCAIALDGSNRPVIVYADVDKGTLRLARASSATPTAASDWKVQKVLPAGDANTGRAADYFAAQFDSTGHLHIVFRNTKGQICYVKSTNANAGASAYTFGKSVVVAENGSRVELTIDGTTPYVAYLSKTNAYDGIQIAYYDANLVKTWKPNGSADQTGAWNIMTAAMKHRAGDARACIAVAPSSVTDWKAAVGYTPGSVYRVVKYVGK